ncbi:MAG: hypothetical protein ACK52I_10825 [Pseudomonadota bacterium]
MPSGRSARRAREAPRAVSAGTAAGGSSSGGASEGAPSGSSGGLPGWVSAGPAGGDSGGASAGLGGTAGGISSGRGSVPLIATLLAPRTGHGPRAGNAAAPCPASWRTTRAGDCQPENGGMSPLHTRRRRQAPERHRQASAAPSAIT